MVMRVTQPTIRLLKKEIFRRLSISEKGKTVKISELLNSLDVSLLCRKRKHERFPAPSMMKLVLFMKLKGIRFQTKLIRHLEKNKEDATNLGFDELPNQRTISHFMNHEISKAEWVYISSLIHHIEKYAEKFGVSLDVNIAKTQPKKKGCIKEH